MNRRQFIATAALATLVPTWLQRRPMLIDLKAFCRTPAWYTKYDMTSPFIQIAGDQPFSFATDGSVCVRVATTERPDGEPESKRPPANNLIWPDRQSAGWKPWPRENHELAYGTTCPACDGDPYKCPSCHSKTPCYEDSCEHLLEKWSSKLVCQTCKGAGDGVFPAVQRVGGLFIEKRYDGLIRSQLAGVEYKTHPNATPQDILMLRFQGGEGLLMSLEPKKTLERMTLKS